MYEHCEYADFGWVALQKDNTVQRERVDSEEEGRRDEVNGVQRGRQSHVRGVVKRNLFKIRLSP